jgi:GNAT superfamily N-acetyltransferase
VSQRPAGAGESGTPVPRLAVCPALDDTALNALFAASWPAHEPTAFGHRHARSLLWIAAFRDAQPDGLTEHGDLAEPEDLRESDSMGELEEHDGRGELVGYVNVVGDGGVHAFLLDTTVHPSARRQGLGVRLAHRAADEARRAGAHWLHVDHEPHLTGFYARCGFAPTAAGLRRLV